MKIKFASIFKAVSFLGLLAMGSCKSEMATIITVFPGENWQQMELEELGIDARRLQEALVYLTSASGEEGLQEVFIARKGYVVYQGDSINRKHDSFSATQSFTSTVLGLLSDFGMIHSSHNAKDVDPSFEELYPTLKMRHFATMTSGYNSKGASRLNDPGEEGTMKADEMDGPLFEPGTAFAYSDQAQIMFGRLLTKRAKKTLKEIFDKNIGNPIGMGAYEWLTEGEVDGIPINNGSTGMIISAEQIARFGHLFLNEGHWAGQQLLSRYWIRKATSNQVKTDSIALVGKKKIDGRGCYGYNWWVNGLKVTGEYLMPDAPKSLYYTGDVTNLRCFVIPEWDMVFIHRAADGNTQSDKNFTYNEFFKRMALAVNE